MCRFNFPFNSKGFPLTSELYVLISDEDCRFYSTERLCNDAAVLWKLLDFSFRKKDLTPYKTAWEIVIFLSFCWLSCYSHRFMDLNGKRGPWRYSYSITSFYRWHYFGTLHLLLSYLSMPWEAPWQQGLDLLRSLLCPQCPSRYSFRFAEQMKKQGLGKRKDLPKIVQPVNRKFWLRNFIFWLQIMWLFHDQNSRFLLRILNYLEALICRKNQNHIQFTFIGYCFSDI